MSKRVKSGRVRAYEAFADGVNSDGNRGKRSCSIVGIDDRFCVRDEEDFASECGFD